MAALSTPLSGDKQSFVDFATIVQKERTLLEEEKTKLKVIWSGLNKLALYLVSIPAAQQQILRFWQLLT